MNSLEIIKKYPNKKFIKVNKFIANSFAAVDNLNTIIDLDDTFIYTEDTLDEDIATDYIIESSLNLAIDTMLTSSILPLSRSTARDLVNEVADEYEDELTKKCYIKSATFFTIRSLKYNIEYTENQIGISTGQQEKIIDWIIEKSKEIREINVVNQAQELEKIKSFILANKSEYLALPSQNAKNKFVKNLQFKLQDEFTNFDGLQKFTLDYIDYILAFESI